MLAQGMLDFQYESDSSWHEGGMRALIIVAPGRIG